jgi:hypothetical protein
MVSVKYFGILVEAWGRGWARDRAPIAEIAVIADIAGIGKPKT